MMEEAVPTSKSLAERQHGGLAQFTAPTESLPTALDFSVNINLYGPSPLMRQRLANCSYEHYPDPKQRNAKSYLCKHLPVSSPKQILLGNGASELIWLAIQNLSRQSDTIAMIEPTFSECRDAAQALGRRIHQIWAAAETHFHLNLPEIEEELSVVKPKIVYLCNPNSPTGHYFEGAALSQLMRAFPDCCFLIDEAFLRLHRDFQSTWLRRPLEANEIRILSYTKDHAIPGVRLGALLASCEIIEHLEAKLPSWNVNAFANSAAQTVYEAEEQAFLDYSHQRIWENHDLLLDALKQMHLPIHASNCPFLLLNVEDADRMQRKLWRRGILVRSCSSYQLKSWVRIFPRHARDNERLLEALKRELSCD